MEELDEFELSDEALEVYINHLADEILELLKKDEEKYSDPLFFVGYG